MSPPRVYRQVLAENRARLMRLTEHGGVARLRGVYDRAEADVVKRLERTAGRGSSKWTVGHMRSALAQIRHGQVVMAQTMTGALSSASRDAQVDSLRGVVQDVRRMQVAVSEHLAPLPVDEAARFAGVIDRHRPSLLRQHASSMSTYGTRLVGLMEKDLAVSLIAGDTTDQAIDRIRARADGERWQAERVVRTELSWASNRTAADGAAEIAKEVPGLLMRWTEHVSDDGQPLDDRVGEDSIVMHGQVTTPGGMFTMPPDPRVSQSLWNLRWAHPPNRPNDRSVLVPWRKDWGSPGWRWSGGGRVPA